MSDRRTRSSWSWRASARRSRKSSAKPPSYSIIAAAADDTIRRERVPRRRLSSSVAARRSAAPLETLQWFEIAMLFDIVNTSPAGIAPAFTAAAAPRSKTQQDCLAEQGVIDWEHPRRTRLGLIEAGNQDRP